MLIGGSGSVGWGENVEGEGGEDGGVRRWGGWWREKVGRMVEGEGGEDGRGRRWGGWWREKVGRMVETTYGVCCVLGITISDTLVVCLVTTKPKGGNGYRIGLVIISPVPRPTNSLGMRPLQKTEG